jgi:Cys-tRNA(Pro)/Cys-tRNA(Cys) deacylase
MSTRAISYLKQNKIKHTVIKYDHCEKGARFASEATGHPLECTIKTLVVDLDSNRSRLVLLPGHRELDLKKLAALYNVKWAALADTKTAQRLTGYLVGGISPFGIRTPLAAVMDHSILECESVLINAGQRGVMLKMAPDDIAAALDCPTAPVAR